MKSATVAMPAASARMSARPEMLASLLVMGVTTTAQCDAVDVATSPAAVVVVVCGA